MLAKLAFGNLRRNLRDHAIYLVTVMLGVAVFYAFNTIDEQATFLDNAVSQTLELIGQLLGGTTVMLAVVLGFLMVYANNYLVKRRKKEFGTYLLLGMRRTQLAGIIAIETATIGIAAYALGIVLGCLVSQLLIFVTATIFNETVTNFHFIFSTQGLLFSGVCFGATFLVTLALNIFTCGRVRIAELMTASRRNERLGVKPLWISVPLTVIGVALIGYAYWRLVRDGLPQTMMGEPLLRFTVTTALMVAGTTSFMFGLPATALALIKLVRPLYYRNLTMVTVREIASRLNRASFTMTITCLVLFFTLCAGVGGFSICMAMNESVEETSPFGASLIVNYPGGYGTEEDFEQNADLSGVYERVYEGVDLREVLEDGIGYQIPATATTSQVNTRLDDGVTYAALAKVVGGLPSDLVTFADSPVNIEAYGDYVATCRQLGIEALPLGEGEYLISGNVGSNETSFFKDVVAAGTAVTVAGRELTPAGVVTGKSAATTNGVYGSNTGTLIVPDEVAESLPISWSYLNITYAGDSEAMQRAFSEQIAEYGIENGHAFTYVLSNGVTYVSPDLDTAEDALVGQSAGTRVVCLVSQTFTYLEAAFSSYQLTGLIAYMAVYLGFVLVISVASVLAIQQVTGVSESAPRYRLLFELGAPRARIARSIAVQVATYFLVPLVVAVSHAYVALGEVGDLVSSLVALDLGPTTLLVGGAFLVVYAAYMAVCWGLSKAAVDAELSLNK